MGTIAKIAAGGATHLLASTCYATCPTAAGTAAKVATVQDSQDFTLFNGVTVHVKFTNANSVANPTLNVNGTGAKAIMRYGTTAVSTSAATSWRAGAVVAFTYDGTNWVENTGIDDNSNTYDRTYFSQPIGKAGGEAIVAGNIICADFDGLYSHLKSGASFRTDMPILYAEKAINANANLTRVYMTIPFAITTTQSLTLIPNRPVWIKGQVYNNMDRTMFGPVSSPVTQDVPTTRDGYQYMLLGVAYSSTGMYLLPEHPIYAFERGMWGPWVPGDPIGIWAGQITGLSISVAAGSNATIFNSGDTTGDMSSHIPEGAVLVGATFGWATGNVLRPINCQVVNGKLHLRVNNPGSAAVTVNEVALQLFYR